MLVGEMGVHLSALGALGVMVLIEQLAGARGKRRCLLGLQGRYRGRAHCQRHTADGGPAVRERDRDFRAGARPSLPIMAKRRVGGRLGGAQLPALAAKPSSRVASAVGWIDGMPLDLCLIGCFGFRGFGGLAARPFRRPRHRSRISASPPLPVLVIEFSAAFLLCHGLAHRRERVPREIVLDLLRAQFSCKLRCLLLAAHRLHLGPRPVERRGRRGESFEHADAERDGGGDAVDGVAHRPRLVGGTVEAGARAGLGGHAFEDRVEQGRAGLVLLQHVRKQGAGALVAMCGLENLLRGEVVVFGGDRIRLAGKLLEPADVVGLARVAQRLQRP